jgi:serine/threonine protein kinase
VVQLKRFDRYEILRKLGRSMTDVYLAFDPATNRRVVLKLVEQSRDEFTRVVIEAERRGAQIQKQLHELDPRILEIYDVGESNGCFFVVMEHFEGRSLAQILEAERRLNPERAARYAIEVLNQLSVLHSFVSDLDGHSRAVVHGDIKPSNIQIGAGDRVRLLDFGIAKVITSTRSLTRHNLGSPTYCSPERLANAQVDAHSDLWALGVSLYEMVAGSLPYQAQSTRRLENLIRSRKPPRALPSDCPPRLRAIVAKALAADIDRRYASAAMFETDLRTFVENRATAAEKEAQPSWESNETVEKSPPAKRTALKRRAAKTLRDHITATRLAIPALRRGIASGAWSIAAGLLIGLFLVAPITYWYNLRRASRVILDADFTRISTAEINADWNLYRKLEHDNSFLGQFSPVASLARTLRSKLMAAADDVIESYRNSSSAALSDFDWPRARLCLAYARQLDSIDRDAHGKLALCDGYINLTQNPDLPKAQWSETDFQLAAGDLPHSPDPHLGLARVYTYAYHNAGKAKSEFTEAERRGFRAGPRELKQQADAYVFRAEWALQQARRKADSSEPDESRWLRQASNDLDRAREMYEPLIGYSNVASSLDQLYQDRHSAEELRAELAPPDPPGPPPSRSKTKRPARRKAPVKPIASMIHGDH